MQKKIKNLKLHSCPWAQTQNNIYILSPEYNIIILHKRISNKRKSEHIPKAPLLLVIIHIMNSKVCNKYTK